MPSVRSLRRACLALFLAVLVSFAMPARLAAQDVPADYQQVLKQLNRPGDYKYGVLKVNVPRNDLSVTVRGRPLPTPFGFGGWVAFTKGHEGLDVMMGDLVLTEDEVTPVMSALLENQIAVTALHNHFFWEQPRVAYLHVHAHGRAAEIARRLEPALKLIGRGPAGAGAAAGGGTPPALAMDTETVARIAGHQGERTGAVYKITVGRPDINLRETGARIDARMGLNSWASFTGSGQDAAIAGDIAMLAGEVQPVLKALRANGLEVVALHHHMIGGEPVVYFLHYWGQGPAEKLARGFRAALDQLP